MIRVLMKAQAELDDLIEKNHHIKRDTFDEHKVSLLVELAECCNEWKRFKYWSKNNKPTHKLLEEYADGLHFILTIANSVEFKVEAISYYFMLPAQEAAYESILHQLIFLNRIISNYQRGISVWEHVATEYLLLGAMLGFTEDEVMDAYFYKNAINRKRQANGY